MWHEYPDQETCIEALAADIAGWIRHRLSEAPRCTIAVSGGRSPIPLFERLSCQALEGSRLRIRLVDERWVPPWHEDSNEALVRRHLLKGSLASADFRGLYLGNASIQEAVAAANDEAEAIDLALLGMGDDGHTASLFPHARQLQQALSPEAACYLHVSPPHAPHERITLSLPALLACQHRILYIAGTHKRDVLQTAETQAGKHFPISHLAAQPGVSFDVYWHP